MKTALTISLAFLFLVQSFTRSFIYLNYEVNKDYISNVLCENKEKKELHCEGKCHLKKELQKEDKKENTPTGSSKEKFEVNLFSEGTFVFFIPIETVRNYPISHVTLLPQNSSISVFHPPKA
ncbi:MAG: hypothetical protein POELPBGB_02837 [Bacteroidia bacterium]|nr:hypothetical protein [Bacteroidia bacterium]